MTRINYIYIDLQSIVTKNIKLFTFKEMPKVITNKIMYFL